MATSNGGALAVVTGASSGIGRALAAELAGHGYELVIAAEDAELAEAEAELRQAGAQVTSVQVDLATFEGVEELFRRVEALGTPDVVAINAGVGVGGAFMDGDLQAHLNLIQLNVTSAVHLAWLLLPAMVAEGDGGLLFTSSIAATMPGPYESTYAASKAFVHSFAEALRVELKDSGIAVTSLMPGPTDTEFFERAGLEDTRLGQSKKDDPRDVARDAYQALMADKDHVVAGSAKNRAQVAAAKVAPDKAAAAMHASLSKPGSGKG